MKKSPSLILLYYSLSITLLMVLPINSAESTLNNNYILEIRFDHFSHLWMFVIWCFIAWVFKDISFRNGILLSLKWIGIGILFAIFAEVIQYFLPYRSFTFRDLMSNVAGVILGISFFLFNADYIRKTIYSWFNVQLTKNN